MEDVGIFYCHSVIWYTLWSFDIYFPFWYVLPRKIWQPFLLNGSARHEGHDDHVHVHDVAHVVGFVDLENVVDCFILKIILDP
jgi:hypothetical protein